MLVDIDGVLSPFGGEQRRERWSVFELNLWYCKDNGRLLNDLKRYYDLVWATMWEHTANEVMAPLHDLDPMPYIKFRKVNLRQQTFKLPAIKEYVGEDRPFAWVDDDIYDDALVWAKARGNALLIPIDPTIGFDEDTARQLERFGKEQHKEAA